jgi:hypothetical protein
MKEERYTITLKGLISQGLSDYQLTTIMDKIELYCRRHGVNGCVFIEDGKFTGGQFIKLEKDEA